MLFVIELTYANEQIIPMVFFSLSSNINLRYVEKKSDAILLLISRIID